MSKKSARSGLSLPLVIILTLIALGMLGAIFVWQKDIDQATNTTTLENQLPDGNQVPSSLSMVDIVGIFQNQSPAADAPERLITFQFNNDLTVEFREEYVGKDLISTNGTWDFEPETNLVTVNFEDGQIMKFNYSANHLILVDYDQNEWGSAGLDLVKNNRAG